MADGAFKDYSTPEEILAVKPPVDERMCRVDWKESMLDLPLFPILNAQGSTGKIQRASTFCHQLADLGHRAGYEFRVTVHDARREALMKADGTPSPAHHPWRVVG